MSKVTLSFVATLTVFAILPLLHLIPDYFEPDSPPRSGFTFDVIPEIIVDQPEVDPPKKKKLEKPKLQKPLDPVDLEKIFNPIEPGPGTISIATDLTSYIDSVDAIATFELPDLDRKPRPIFQVEPFYPYSLKNQKIGGWVILEWVINTRGNVEKIRVIDSSHREFQQAAIDSILKSKWEPGEIESKPVNVRVRQRINFSP